MLHTQYIYIYIYIYIHEVICDPFANVCLFIYLFVYLFISGAFAKLRKATASYLRHASLSVNAIRPTVCPYGTTRLPLDRFLLTLIFEDFSKVCRENLKFY